MRVCEIEESTWVIGFNLRISVDGSLDFVIDFRTQVIIRLDNHGMLIIFEWFTKLYGRSHVYTSSGQQQKLSTDAFD